jgi:hypothetical protein
MWISEYNDELTEYIENVRLYGVLWNMNFVEICLYECMRKLRDFVKKWIS